MRPRCGRFEGIWHWTIISRLRQRRTRHRARQTRCEPRIDSGDHQSGQQGGSHEPTDHHSSQRALNFRAGCGGQCHGQEPQTVNQRGHQDESNASDRRLRSCRSHFHPRATQAFRATVQDVTALQRQVPHRQKPGQQPNPAGPFPRSVVRRIVRLVATQVLQHNVLRSSSFSDHRSAANRDRVIPRLASASAGRRLLVSHHLGRQASRANVSST